jgi:hypothetical protein
MSRAKNRPTRTPVATRNILTTDQRDGYVRRWVNDTPGRIDMFKEAGYEPVRQPTKVGDPRAGDGSNVGSSVIEKDVGAGQKAFLMEIPIEYYTEDQAAKEQGLKTKEASLIPDELKRDTYGEGLTISSTIERNKKSHPKVVIQ